MRAGKSGIVEEHVVFLKYFSIFGEEFMFSSWNTFFLRLAKLVRTLRISHDLTSLWWFGDAIQNPAKTNVIHPYFLEGPMILRVYNVVIYFDIYIYIYTVVRSPKVTTPWKSKLTIEITGELHQVGYLLGFGNFNHPKLGVAIILIDIPLNPVFYFFFWCVWNNPQITG